MPLGRQYEAGENELVAERLRDVVDENPQYALLHYNLACLEDRRGDRAAAIRHLIAFRRVIGDTLLRREGA